MADGYDSIIPAMLSDLPTVLIAVVVILVLSASMSTLSSLVLTSASTLTLDFIKGVVIKDMDEKRQVRCMKRLIVVFIAISVALAIVQYRSNVTFIAQLMGVSWGALAGAFCMVAGLLIVPAVSLLTRAPDKARLAEIFACYERTVQVKAKDSIGENDG